MALYWIAIVALFTWQGWRMWRHRGHSITDPSSCCYVWKHPGDRDGGT